MAGKVYLVGAGPGAADLITLRGADVLRRAGIVFFDALVHADTLALAVDAEKIAVGKRCGRHSTAQRFINKRLIDAAASHAVVVRLKGGDPMLFGRAHEELQALQEAGIEVEIVPGVTAALAASAAVQVSLTRRGVARSVTFVTPRTAAGEPQHDWAGAIAAADTGVIYMGAGEAEEITRALIAAGVPASTPVLVVENASLPAEEQTRLTLGDLPGFAAGRHAGPVLIMLGRVYGDAYAAAKAGARAALG
jgi:uroporphyrin-III C-methyltransferase